MKIKSNVCAYVKVTPYTCDFTFRNQPDPWEMRLQSASGWRKFLNQKTKIRLFDRKTGELIRDVENIFRVLRRARKTVVDYALCNAFEYFGTITIDNEKWDVLRPDIIQKVISSVLHSYQQTHPNLKYLFTAEYGEKTKCLHFHFLASGLETFVNEHGYPDCHLFRDNFGFCQISRIGDTEADKLYSSLYCSKYISKQSMRIAFRYYFCKSWIEKTRSSFSSRFFGANSL